MATKALFNTVLNWFIRQRIDQIQNFTNHPIETQNGVLFSQLYYAENNDYGRIHGFSSISSYEDSTRNVSIVIYEDFEPFIEQARQGQRDVFWPGLVKNFAKTTF